MPNTIRVTMFKIGGPSSNIDKFLDLYRTLAKTAVKVLPHFSFLSPPPNAHRFTHTHIYLKLHTSNPKIAY
jgi:hypothetical protein